MKNATKEMNASRNSQTVHITVHDPDKHVKSTTVNAHKNIGGN